LGEYTKIRVSCSCDKDVKCTAGVHDQSFAGTRLLRPLVHRLPTLLPDQEPAPALCRDHLHMVS
jgi:hypothetical protein